MSSSGVAKMVNPRVAVLDSEPTHLRRMPVTVLAVHLAFAGHPLM